MKALRIIYYISMPAFLIAGLYNGITANFIVFFAQLFLALAAAALNFWTVYSFKYTQKLQDEVGLGGGETALRIKIQNPGPLPVALMEIEVSTADPGEKKDLSFSLPPFSEKSFDIPILMPYCGVYEIGMAKTHLTDIFGLMRLPFDMRKLFYYRQPRLTVYPAVEPLSGVSASLMDEKLFGGAYLKLAEEGDSMAGLREYREGDAEKRIHWKRSAGQVALYVKQYDQPLRERVLIVADASPHGLKGEEKLIYADTLCRAAAALCRHSLLRKREASIFAKSASDAQPNRCAGAGSLEPFLKWLAMLRFDGTKAGFAEALECAVSEADEAASIFVLTREPDEKLINYLESISVRVSSVSLIRIEEKKAYDGRLHTLFIKPGEGVAKSLEVDL